MYIQGAIFTVPILISGLLPLPSYYLGIEVGKKLNTENEQNMSSGPFRMTVPFYILVLLFEIRFVIKVLYLGGIDGGVDD